MKRNLKLREWREFTGTPAEVLAAKCDMTLEEYYRFENQELWEPSETGEEYWLIAIAYDMTDNSLLFENPWTLWQESWEC